MLRVFADRFIDTAQIQRAPVIARRGRQQGGSFDFRGYKDFLLISLCLLLAGVGLSPLADLVPSTHPHLHSLLDHVSEALIVAALAVANVEAYVRHEATEHSHAAAGELAKNVFSAVFHRLVPEKIAEALTRVLREGVCRIEPHYVVRITRAGFTDIPADRVVVSRDLTYRLRNLTEEPVRYLLSIITSSISRTQLPLTCNGEVILLPRIGQVTIDGKPVQLPSNNETSFEEEITLPVMRSSEDGCIVSSRFEELFHASDRAYYTITTACYDRRVKIENDVRDVSVKAVKLTNGSLRNVGPDEWRCDSGLLPGTTLSIYWEKA